MFSIHLSEPTLPTLVPKTSNARSMSLKTRLEVASAKGYVFLFSENIGWRVVCLSLVSKQRHRDVMSSSFLKS
jgi:hypothetical protein